MEIVKRRNSFSSSRFLNFSKSFEISGADFYENFTFLIEKIVMDSLFFNLPKPKTRIALVGHEYIKRMPKIHIKEAIVQKFCYEGAFAISFSSTQITEIRKFSPDIIFLHIGGNDIGLQCPLNIAEDICQLIKPWKVRQIPVLIGEIEFRRKTKVLSFKQYNKHRKELNDILEDLYGNRFIRYSFYMNHYLLRNGVHLNFKGNQLLSRDIKTNILNHLEKLN